MERLINMLKMISKDYKGLSKANVPLPCECLAKSSFEFSKATL